MMPQSPRDEPVTPYQTRHPPLNHHEKPKQSSGGFQPPITSLNRHETDQTQQALKIQRIWFASPAAPTTQGDAVSRNHSEKRHVPQPR